MPFIVPKFIEREPKIVGPLTFKQFLFFLVGGGVILFLYLTLKKKSFPLFLLLMLVTTGISFLLAFGKASGRPIPIFLKNFFTFLGAPKLFAFKKKIFAPRLFPERLPKLKEGPVLKPTDKGRLRQLSTQIETKRR
jgi:hypothetical protein